MPNSNSTSVRFATQADTNNLLMLIDALADYEKLDRPDDEAKKRLLDEAFSEKPRFKILLAVTADDQPIGYAFLLETFSSFLAKPTLYLEDLFILPDHRGTGAGSVLFDGIKAEAKRRGCGRIEFVVLEWNTLAQEFYHRKGGKHVEGWRFYRVDAENF